MMRFATHLVTTIIIVWGCGGTLPGVEIPLIVTEQAGKQRVSNHVSSGIPFPQGVVKHVGTLGLFTENGQSVPAAFVVRQTYLADGSVRWATVHFLASVPAKGVVRYVIRDKVGIPPVYPIRAQHENDKVTVDTGAIKFTMAKEPFALIQEAWMDPEGRGQYDRPAIEFGSTRLVANMVSGRYTVAGIKGAKCADASEPFDATLQCDTLEIEENTPVRVVVKAAGCLLKGQTPTVDFLARLYAMAGSPAVRIHFSVINRRGKAWNEFFGFRELSLNVSVKPGSSVPYTFGASEGDDLRGALKAGETATLLQPYSEHYKLGGAASGEGKAKSIRTRRLGWASLEGKTAGVAGGIRYFWQLHPKGLAVQGDGTLSLQIVPRQEKPVAVPPDVVSQADTRVDFFTGAARTHELLLVLFPPGTDASCHVMGVIDPLFAFCPTSWYCQDTQAEGPLFDNNLENYKPEYRELVAAFNQKVEAVFDECAGQKRRDGKRGTEEFGFWSFGAGTEAKGKKFIARNDWLNTRWDGNYYDFPRAVLVAFWRSGKTMFWDVAQDSALHLADVDIAHVHPQNPTLAGIERTCPNRGHFRQWWRGEPFGVSGNMDSTKSQSLYDLYHMTGDRWFLDVALLVAQYNLRHTGGALRSIGNRGLTLTLAYEQTGDATYRDEAIAWLNRTIGNRSPTVGWDQYWQYGLPSEAAMRIYRLSGNIKMAQTLVNCCDSLINAYWISEKQATRDLNGFTVICYGHAYELTGNELYLKKGLHALKATVEEYAGSTKTFAQSFRISPYFLYYLTQGYKPPKPVIEKSNANK